MSKYPHIYQKDGLGWYIDTGDRQEGPVDSRQDAVQLLNLLQLTDAARTEFVCLDRECF
ncbi:MAG: hypothetical protein OEZ38_14150 [Gammaproteobacteria bacterium]|nr:hypothetical protein [Gammaproteobacteria bacterium]